jgi:hypothetical protein
MTRLLCLVLMVLFLGACSVPEKAYHFSDITEVKEEEVSRVEMRDGSTGELRTVVQREDIEALFNILKTLEYTRQTPQNQTTGYTYYADFYSGDNRLLRITFSGERVQVDNTNYLINREILDFLEKIFKSAI